MNTTDNDIELTNLESDALYRVLVFARNEHGTSLPSAMLLINTTDNGNDTLPLVCNVQICINFFVL